MEVLCCEFLLLVREALLGDGDFLAADDGLPADLGDFCFPFEGAFPTFGDVTGDADLEVFGEGVLEVLTVGDGVFVAFGDGVFFVLGEGVFFAFGDGVFFVLGDGVFAVLGDGVRDAFGVPPLIGVLTFFCGLSSLIGDAFMTLAASDLLFSNGLGELTVSTGMESLLGVAPRLTGVSGGRNLLKCSGLRAGPNETRFRLGLGAMESRDFLFFPVEAFLPDPDMGDAEITT